MARPAKPLLAVLLLCQPALPFYVPGVAPQDFHAGSDIDVKAVKMTSAHTQLPYEYYSLELCKPKDGVVQYSTAENIGQIIRGERIVNTPYAVKMNTSAEASYRIEHEYFVHLIMDNLPCATRFSMPDTGEVQYEPGYRLGYHNNGKNYINNHLKFVLKYHLDEEQDTYRVVGFLIETQSIDKR